MARNSFTESAVLDWLANWSEFASETVDGKRLRFYVMQTSKSRCYKVTHGEETLWLGQNFKEAYKVYKQA